MKMKILFVDEDENLVTQTKSMLEKDGFSVFTAQNLSDGLKIFEEKKPNLVVVALMMQHQDDGFIFSYKAKQKAPNTPIILISDVTSETGLIFDAAREEEKAWVKADSLIAKPFRYEQLKLEIYKLLHIKH